MFIAKADAIKITDAILKRLRGYGDNWKGDRTKIKFAEWVDQLIADNLRDEGD